jgi:WD40 repeat protein
VHKNAEIAGGDLSEDGKYFIVEYFIGEKMSELVLFDVLAKKPLWVKRFEDETIYDMAVSPQGNYVAVGTRTDNREYFIYVYSTQGSQIISKEIGYGGNYYVAFSDDERFLIAGSSKGNIYAFSIETKKLSWSYSTGDKNIGFLNFNASSGFIATSVITKNPTGGSDSEFPRYLYVFDNAGNLLLKRKFTDHGIDRWDEGQKVELRNSGSKIRVTLNDKLYEFENEFAKGK